MTPNSTCSKCAKPVTPGNRFCPACGSDVSAEQAMVTTAERSDETTLSVHAEAELVAALHHATLGEYDVMGELGRGGMAIVYLAHDIALNRKVAIKVMLPALTMAGGMAERFKREAQTAGSLSHPNIIPIYTVKQTEKLLLFVMKFVPGRALDSVIEEASALPIRMVQTILAQTGSALSYAHRQGVVHRDVKPANIMLDEEGWAVVTDFGIAKVSEAEGLTTSGAIVGTPSYMSPEQCGGAKDLTGASDQYSLGIVAYEMLTGKPPFRADTLFEMFNKHFSETPRPIDYLRDDCPQDLAQAVSQMLAKEPTDRFETLDQMVEAIGATPLAANDPIRSHMIKLAQSGVVEQRMKRVSTPRSPIPSASQLALAEAETTAVKLHRRWPWVLVASVMMVLASGSSYYAGLWPARVAVLDNLLGLDEPAPVQASGAVDPNATTQIGDSAVVGESAVDSEEALIGLTTNANPEVGTLESAPSQPPTPQITEGFVLLGSRGTSSFLWVNDRLQDAIVSPQFWPIAPGVVHLSIRQEGCSPWDTTLTVSAGDSLRLGWKMPDCPQGGLWL